MRWTALLLVLLLRVSAGGDPLEDSSDAHLPLPNEKYKLGIVTTYKPALCGVAKFSENMIKGFFNANSRMRIEVFSLSRTPPRPPRREDGVKIIELHSTEQTEAREFEKLVRYVKKKNFNGILVNHEFFLLSCLKNYERLVSGLKDAGVTVYTIIHNLTSYPNKEQKSHIRKIAQFSDYLFSMSWKGKYYLHHSYGIAPRKIVYFPHGIHAVSPKKRVLEALSVPDDKFVIYSDGILHADKGIEKIVGALRILKKRKKICGILLVIAGLHSKTPSYIEKIKKMVSRWGLESHVMWISKFLSDEEMATLHARSNIYITLFNEVIPTSGTLTYAMYVGDTIVSTPYRYSLELLGVDNAPGKGTDLRGVRAVGSGKHWISHAGVSVPFQSPGTLASVITMLKNNPGLSARLKQHAKRRVKGYSWSNVSKHIAYFMKTKKIAHVNPNPYHLTYFPSVCMWKGTTIVDFFGKRVTEPVPNGTYVLYRDSFVNILARVARNRIRKIVVKSGRRPSRVIQIEKVIEVHVDKNISILSSDDAGCCVCTPNVIFKLQCSRQKKLASFVVLYENMYGSGVGALGSTLRGKYDLTQKISPPIEQSRVKGTI